MSSPKRKYTNENEEPDPNHFDIKKPKSDLLLLPFQDRKLVDKISRSNSSIDAGDEDLAERRRRKAPNFSEEEDILILQGYHKFGENWEEISSWGRFDSSRTASSIRGRWQRLRQKENKIASPSKDDPPTPARFGTRKISEYFKPLKPPEFSEIKIHVQDNDANTKEAMEKLKQELELVQCKNYQLSASCEELESEVQSWKKKCTTLETKTIERAKKTCEVLVEILREQCKYQAREKRRKIAEDSLRLANLISERHGVDFVDSWQEGYLFQDIQNSVKLISKQREEAEKRKKALLKQARQGKEDETDYFQEEILKLSLLAMKKNETELLSRLERLTMERDLHIKACRRIRDEDCSRFNHNPVLNERYLLLEMIGKGGFSEVYKAFDLIELQVVACNEQWSHDRKKSYTKHSIREYHIHKLLDHPHIVKLYDVFEYDQYSFCTILEYVSGEDLESYLHVWKQMPEKEARAVIIQVMSALKYLNELENPIIHYDLKPGNFLLQNGHVKLTDFGLSKIISDRVAPKCLELETDLTSQGAGTYWYLPPEVFERSEKPIKISSKVDVWSIGCIFYEMIYGRKPFGNDKSQYSILKESVISKDAQILEFPQKPIISAECKDFIKKCLQYRKEERPDILTL